MNNNKKTIKLGVLSNEFFDVKLGRMGGFGWAVRQLVEFFTSKPDSNIEVVLLAGNKLVSKETMPDAVHGVKIVYRYGNTARHIRALKKEKIDLILTIDYRSSYRKVLNRLPFTPVLIWVRDPRTAEDVKKVQSIRIPNEPGVVPKGLEFVDCTSVRRLIKFSRLYGRKITFAATTPFLLHKIPGTYGLDFENPHILPNIINLTSDKIEKSKKPKVVFLGRLDPYKRPWLFAELAGHFPDVDFIFLGQDHFEGAGTWKIENIPPNVQFMGHVNETEKQEFLKAAWVLINTSVHEGLAVSFLEALKMETPLLSSVNPENTVSRFGLHVGNFGGDGREAIPYFVKGLTQLLENENMRNELGKAGRKWVEEVHNEQTFFEAFRGISKTLGVKM
ncbi:MAG: glycosyltransferase family 4 protein [Methyloligellaceae bacterium]